MISFLQSKFVNIWGYQRSIFIALREGYLTAKGFIGLIVHWENGYKDLHGDFRIEGATFLDDPKTIPKYFWDFEHIFWTANQLIYVDRDDFSANKKWLAATDIFIATADLYRIFPAPVKKTQKIEALAASPKKGNPYWIEFLDASGEVVLNGLFTVAKPETNGQNYKIIKYLIANPNKFVTADDLKANALGGKNLDKRLTDFAAQINMNKDLGKLFFDTGNDSIRLNNPVTPERMTEQNIRRVRIKPA